MDPVYKNRYNLDTTNLTDLIKDLRKYSLEVDMLKKMAHDFNWDFQQVLMAQIKVLINRQILEFDIKTDVFGKDEVSFLTVLFNRFQR